LPQGDANGSQSNASRIEETVNYEISRTVKTHVRETGTVRRLSVAVMVNGVFAEDENGNKAYQPRTPEELERLTALVRSAVGYNEERGDKIELANLPFVDLEQELAEEAEEPGLLGLARRHLTRVAEILVLGVVAVLVLLLVVRPLVGRVVEGGLEDGAARLTDQTGGRAALPGPEEETQSNSSEVVAEEIEQMIDLNKVEGRVRASSIKKIGEIVEKHPDEAVAILRSWLYQET
jgi:flagellar M-ring protein FliF